MLEPKVPVNSPAGREIELVVDNLGSLISDIALARTHTKNRANTVILDARLATLARNLERAAQNIAVFLEGYPEPEEVIG